MPSVTATSLPSGCNRDIRSNLFAVRLHHFAFGQRHGRADHAAFGHIGNLDIDIFFGFDIGGDAEYFHIVGRLVALHETAETEIETAVFIGEVRKSEGVERRVRHDFAVDRKDHFALDFFNFNGNLAEAEIGRL